ncbi:right-handed parallel beta-helix repeat-containing protein [Bacillus spongiae]|uniref:Right-handed parallel beta-helix repeat-containing protein n=1 Tax=Bacillus spongiae TaxID=2683610 RepID=A0ABU8HG47_9BACI
MLINGNNNVIIECSTLMNQSEGIVISSGQNNCVIKCESNNNNNDGFFINSSPNTIFGNISIQSKNRGILVMAFTSNNNIVKNLICNNSRSGIEIEGFAVVNVIDSNIVSINGTDMTDAGILVQDIAIDNTIRFNKATNNVDFDIEAELGAEPPKILSTATNVEIVTRLDCVPKQTLGVSTRRVLICF